MTDTDIVGNLPSVALPSLEDLRQLLPWSQGATDALLDPSAEDWKGLAKQAANLLPFLSAGDPDHSPDDYDDGQSDGAPVTPADLFSAYRHAAYASWMFDKHARQVGADAAAAAIILTDVAESLDLEPSPGPVALDKALKGIAQGDFDLPARTEELLAAVRSGMEPDRTKPDLPDPNVLAHLLRNIHPPGPDSHAPLWPQVIHQARRIALFDRLVPRQDWRQAQQQLGRHGAAAATIIAMAKQSLGLVSDPADSLRGTVALAFNKPAALDRTVHKLIKATAKQSLLPEPAMPGVETPSLERARKLYGRLGRINPLPPTGPDANNCSWHNLYDRIVRIHIPFHFGKKTDLKEAKDILGKRAFTVVAMLAVFRRSCLTWTSELTVLCFESAVRAAGAGALDLDEIVSDAEEDEDPLKRLAFASPLKPVPDINDIRDLIPETRWAPASDERGQQHGWASVIENARMLGREALAIDNETWARLENKIGARSAAAAVLYAAPRPCLAAEPRLIDRIAGLTSMFDSAWFPGVHRRAVDAIETVIDLAVVAALENCPFQPETPELLPDLDIVQRYGPRSIRELVGDSSELDWDELTAAAHDLATGRLSLSEDDWQRACRILGPLRAAAAALAAAAIQEQLARRSFGKIVFHEATHPGSLPDVIESKWIPYQSERAFQLSDSASAEPAP